MVTGISFLIVILALLLIFWGGKLLFSSRWLVGFMRGSLGLLLLAGALIAVLIAVDIYSYRNLTAEHSVGTVAFERLEEQLYRVKFADEDGIAQHFEVSGDQWQLEARMLKWRSWLARWGVEPAYRLDRLSGRYLTLQDEREKPRSAHALQSSKYGVDVWQLLRELDGKLPLVDAVYGSATFMPMQDGAMYGVHVTHSGLLARPLNQRARSALHEWQ